MNKAVLLPNDFEFTVNIENIKFRLLVSKADKNEKEENIAWVLHNHVSAELFAASDSEIKISTENGTIVLKKGDIAIIPPGIRHAMFPESAEASPTVISFICSKRNDRCTADIYKKMTPYISGTDITVCRDVLPLCIKIREIYESSGNIPDEMQAIKAVMVLMELLLIQKCESDKIFDTAVEKYDIQRMMKLDNLVGRYYKSNLKSADIARELYVSSRQLDRIARKRYGKTLRKVIMEKRVQAAEKILLTTDMSIEKIGSEVGFSSNAGFYREFEAVYGITPAKYRKNSKNLL